MNYSGQAREESRTLVPRSPGLQQKAKEENRGKDGHPTRASVRHVTRVLKFKTSSPRHDTFSRFISFSS